jgi:hypothetical protein
MAAGATSSFDMTCEAGYAVGRTIVGDVRVSRDTVRLDANNQIVGWSLTLVSVSGAQQVARARPLCLVPT